MSASPEKSGVCMREPRRSTLGFGSLGFSTRQRAIILVECAVAAGAIITAAGALNGWVMMQGQIPMAAARDGLLQLMMDRHSSIPAGILLLVMVAVIAFGFSFWARYGSGAEAVFWGFLVLVAGIPIYTWRKWRSGMAAAKTGS